MQTKHTPLVKAVTYRQDGLTSSSPEQCWTAKAGREGTCCNALAPGMDMHVCTQILEADKMRSMMLLSLIVSLN